MVNSSNESQEKGIMVNPSNESQATRKKMEILSKESQETKNFKQAYNEGDAVAAIKIWRESKDIIKKDDKSSFPLMAYLIKMFIIPPNYGWQRTLRNFEDIKKNRVDIIKELLKDKSLKLKTNSPAVSCLYEALNTGDHELAKLILAQKDIDVNFHARIDSQYVSVLGKAIEEAYKTYNFDLVEKIIKNKDFKRDERYMLTFKPKDDRFIQAKDLLMSLREDMKGTLSEPEIEACVRDPKLLDKMDIKRWYASFPEIKHRFEQKLRTLEPETFEKNPPVKPSEMQVPSTLQMLNRKTRQKYEENRAALQNYWDESIEFNKSKNAHDKEVKAYFDYKHSTEEMVYKFEAAVTRLAQKTEKLFTTIDNLNLTGTLPSRKAKNVQAKPVVKE